MKFAKLFKKDAKKKILVDFYSDSIEKIGRDQIKKIVERGLTMQGVSLS